jgi:hypothetical protein
VHRILKKLVFGLDGKNSFKNGQEVDFQFYTKKNGQKYPFLSCSKRPHLENCLSVKAEILLRFLKKIVLDLMEKIPSKMIGLLIFNFTKKKTAKNTHF